MSLYESIFFVAVFVLGSLAFLLPIFPAMYYARTPGGSLPKRRMFVAASFLLAYGILGASGIVFAPIELTAIFLAPQWQSDGDQLAATMVGYVSALNPFLPLGAGVIASFLVPRWLAPRWRSIASALDSPGIHTDR